MDEGLAMAGIRWPGEHLKPEDIQLAYRAYLDEWRAGQCEFILPEDFIMKIMMDEFVRDIVPGLPRTTIAV